MPLSNASKFKALLSSLKFSPNFFHVIENWDEVDLPESITASWQKILNTTPMTNQTVSQKKINQKVLTDNNYLILFLKTNLSMRGGAYFNVDTQRWGAYYWAGLIWGPTLITENMVLISNSVLSLKGKFIRISKINT